MTTNIDWERQYQMLLKQMKDMMRMTIKLLNTMEEQHTIIEDILIEKEDCNMYVLVISSGNSPVYKYKFFDVNNNIIYIKQDTYKNYLIIPFSLELNIEKIEVSIKDKKNDKYSEPKVIKMIKNI